MGRSARHRVLHVSAKYSCEIRWLLICWEGFEGFWGFGGGGGCFPLEKE